MTKKVKTFNAEPTPKPTLGATPEITTNTIYAPVHEDNGYSGV